MAGFFFYYVSFAFISSFMCNLFVIIFGFLIGLACPLVALILHRIGHPTGLKNPCLSPLLML
jgi:hypothetical protein